MTKIDTVVALIRCDNCGRQDRVEAGELTRDARNRLKREGWHSHSAPAALQDRYYDHCQRCPCPIAVEVPG